ncbi:MAG: CheY-like chemotaxis protein [Myxococcota bacterium]|jgi:CheY-like chemotaxis protein
MSANTELETTIWIIDDDDVEALLIREALNRSVEPVEFHAFSDAESVKSALANTSIPRPDLVILDYFLPDAEAPELLPVLRESLDWTPIVVLSALTEKASVRRCFDARASMFVEKPPSYAELSSAMARISDVWLNVALRPGRASN